MTKMTVDEAKEFINDHTDIDVVFDERLNFQSETKSLVLQDTDLDKLLAFIDDQEKEKQESKEELKNLMQDYNDLTDRFKKSLYPENLIKSTRFRMSIQVKQ